MACIVAYQNLESYVETLQDRQSSEIIYLSQDCERHFRLRQLYGEAYRQINGETLNDIFDAITNDLINLDQQLLKHEEDRILWHASLLSDLSPYMTDLQMQVCYFLVMLRMIKEEGFDGIFVCDTPDLVYVFSKAAEKNQISLKMIGTAFPLKNSVWPRIRCRLSALKTVFKSRRELRKARRDHKIDLEALRKCDVILFDWLQPTTFSGEGKIANLRNLRSLPLQLSEAGLKCAILGNPISWIYPYRDILNNAMTSQYPILLVDDCRSILSVLTAALKTLFFNGRMETSDVCINGCDVTEILKLANRYDQVSSHASMNLTYVDIVRFLKAQSIFPRTIIMSYENQGWERVFRHAVRELLPNTKILSYQYVPISKRFVSFFPSSTDILSDTIPDRLMTLGDIYSSWFEEKGMPSEKLQVVGSLQFDKALKQSLDLKTQDVIEGLTVLCSTSIKYSECLDQVLKTVEAVLSVEGARVIVNFHPVVNSEFKENIRSEVSGVFGTVDQCVEFSESSTSSLMKKADVVTYNSSGSSFDASLAGVPVIYVALDGSPNYNRLLPEHSYEVYSVEELITCLRAQKAGKLSALTAATLQKYIKPFDPVPFIQ